VRTVQFGEAGPPKRPRVGRVVLNALATSRSLQHWRNGVDSCSMLTCLMRFSDFIARTITQRRALVWCGVSLLTAACIAILVSSLKLDSEIFNVLPGKFSSVQGLKIYDRDFEQ